MTESVAGSEKGAARKLELGLRGDARFVPECWLRLVLANRVLPFCKSASGRRQDRRGRAERLVHRFGCGRESVRTTERDFTRANGFDLLVQGQGTPAHMALGEVQQI